MSPPPLVSVLIPAYRHAEYVEACLQSVIDQTYSRLELILIDDNSPDRTFEIAQDVVGRHASRFERIELRRNVVNRGAHASLNRALGLAQGDFVSFMNSDDLYTPTRIETMLDALSAQGGGFGFSRVQTIDERGAPTFAEALCHHIFWRPDTMRRRMPSLSWGMLTFQLTASTGNLFFERSLAERIGRFRNLKYCHDWDYVLRACFHEEPIYVPESLYLYRVHGRNSFRSLTSVADSETKAVLRAYFTQVMTSRPFNPLAPAPQNWPGSFSALVAACGHEAMYRRLYEPYKKHFRTVEPKLAASAS